MLIITQQITAEILINIKFASVFAGFWLRLYWVFSYLNNLFFFIGLYHASTLPDRHTALREYWMVLYTIRDAILTYAQKLTRVSLIYRTEPTAKKWKNRQSKTYFKNGYAHKYRQNSPENPWSQSWRRKWRLRWEGFKEKEGFKPGMKEWRGDGTLVIISINASSITTV